MDAKSVVMELLDKGVIDDGIKNKILGEFSTRLQNEMLHDCLKTRCTDDALKAVCDVIIQVAGNPKMTALGEVMLRELETGKCSVCVHVCMYCMCECFLPLQLKMKCTYCVSPRGARGWLLSEDGCLVTWVCGVCICRLP